MVSRGWTALHWQFVPGDINLLSDGAWGSRHLKAQLGWASNTARSSGLQLMPAVSWEPPGAYMWPLHVAQVSPSMMVMF